MFPFQVCRLPLVVVARHAAKKKQQNQTADVSAYTVLSSRLHARPLSPTQHARMAVNITVDFRRSGCASATQ